MTHTSPDDERAEVTHAARDANRGGSEQMYAGYYVVALMDILGQKKELNRISSIVSRPEKEGDVKESTGDLCRHLKLVRNVFNEGCQMQKTSPPTAFRLTDEQQTELDAINTFEPPTFQGFGDTVIAYTPVKNRDGKLTMQAADAFFFGCTLTMLTCLAERLPIRGAINVDFGFDCFEGEIYGPALQSVHLLEQEVCGYPRIVVGAGLRRYLSRFTAIESDACLPDRFNAQLAAFATRLIVPDVDGVPILDYAGVTVQERLSAVPYLSHTLERARDFSHAEYVKFVSNGDRKHALRYARLQGYLTSRIQN